MDLGPDAYPRGESIASPRVIVVNAQLGIKSVPELIAYAKKNPGKLNFAHSGTGTPQHMAGVRFKQLTGVDIMDVPFKGGAPALQSVLGGDPQYCSLPRRRSSSISRAAAFSLSQ